MATGVGQLVLNSDRRFEWHGRRVRTHKRAETELIGDFHRWVVWYLDAVHYSESGLLVSGAIGSGAISPPCFSPA